MSSAAFISGCEGLVLSGDEVSFFKDSRPWGLILFKRNCDTPDQIRALVDQFRAAVGVADAPVLIDQEGGRVQRLSQPHWPVYPAAATVADVMREHTDRAAWLHGRILAADLHALGITVDCLPVLDIAFPETHAVIGNRSFGADPATVTRLGKAQLAGLAAGGVLGVMKHIPGHGRATLDSHLELPIVHAPRTELERLDFAPFADLAAVAPMAMTAHVVYTALDADHPATTSPAIVSDVIRGQIGFDGLLMTDDLSMKALEGTFEEKVAASLSAGCDMVLHCNGVMSEMIAVASATPMLSGEPARRANAVLAAQTMADDSDLGALRAELAGLTTPKAA